MNKIFEGVKLVSPILMIFLTFYISTVKDDIAGVKNDISRARQEISHHLQNSDLHVPRATVVSKDEFCIYQTMRDRQMSDIRDYACRSERMMERILERMAK